jgi:hypothetical protein
MHAADATEVNQSIFKGHSLYDLLSAQSKALLDSAPMNNAPAQVEVKIDWAKDSSTDQTVVIDRHQTSTLQ